MKKKLAKKLTTPTKSRATSFATRQDLAHFARCVTDGGTVKECLSVGDNGVGAWGDDTWRTTGPAICALPANVAVHNKTVRVTLSIGTKAPFECICCDIAPPGVIDLNPAALIAGGLGPDDDIDDSNAQWEWV